MNTSEFCRRTRSPGSPTTSPVLNRSSLSPSQMHNNYSSLPRNGLPSVNGVSPRSSRYSSAYSSDYRTPGLSSRYTPNRYSTLYSRDAQGNNSNFSKELRQRYLPDEDTTSSYSSKYLRNPPSSLSYLREPMSTQSHLRESNSLSQRRESPTSSIIESPVSPTFRRKSPITPLRETSRIQESPSVTSNYPYREHISTGEGLSANTSNCSTRRERIPYTGSLSTGADYITKRSSLYRRC